jgi:hypothetical protein
VNIGAQNTGKNAAVITDDMSRLIIKRQNFQGYFLK